MRVLETKVYQFDELSDKGKENARAWWREASQHDEFWEFTYEDFIEILKRCGFEVETKARQTRSGKTIHDPSIFFSGFWSQGDGASFEATFRLQDALNAEAAVKDHAPTDERLHGIAIALEVSTKKFLQALNLLDLLRSSVNIGIKDHRYCHEMTMDAESELLDDISYQMGDSYPEDDVSIVDLVRDFEKAVLDEARDLARWLYRQLEDEYNYQNSDEQVDERIQSGEFEFTENGRRCACI